MTENPFGEGGFDLGAMLEQAQQMQAQLMQAQAELAEQTVEGTAGGVKVHCHRHRRAHRGRRPARHLRRHRRGVAGRPRRPGRGGLPRRQGARRTPSRALGARPARRRPRRARTRGPGVAPGGLRAAAPVYEGVVQDLIDELGRLPGVGSQGRPADRLPPARRGPGRRAPARRGARSRSRRRPRFCAVCGNVAEEEQCRICRDPRRDPTLICVVEESKDVVAIERTREFRGRYHVLGGAISPLEGIGPDQLRIRELLARLEDGHGDRDHPGHRPEHRG